MRKGYSRNSEGILGISIVIFIAFCVAMFIFTAKEGSTTKAIVEFYDDQMIDDIEKGRGKGYDVRVKFSDGKKAYVDIDCGVFGLSNCVVREVRE